MTSLIEEGKSGQQRGITEIYPQARLVSQVGRERWRRQRRLELIALPAGLLLLVGLWTLVTMVGQYPTFILPDPLTVFRELVEITVSGILWHHTIATLQE